MPRLGCIQLPSWLESKRFSRDAHAGDPHVADSDSRSFRLGVLGTCLGLRGSLASRHAATRQPPPSSSSGSGSDAGGAGSDAMHVSDGSTAESVTGSDDSPQRSMSSSPDAVKHQLDGTDESSLLLWRRFSMSQHLSSLSPAWRRLVGCFEYSLVARPSNDKSLGLQGWRGGALRRWELTFPVITIFDAPGQAEPGEGFHEWPLFDIFKIDLRALSDWNDYLASLKRAERWNVKQRCKLFRSLETEGRLVCELVALGPEAFDMSRSGAVTEDGSSHWGSADNKKPTRSLHASRSSTENATAPVLALGGKAVVVVEPLQRTPEQHSQRDACDPEPRPLKQGKRRGGACAAASAECAAPPLPARVTPGSAAEAEGLVEQLWSLYEQTGSRNGFVECTKENFRRLLREAPGVQVVLVLEGPSSSAASAPSSGAAPGATGDGAILGFGVLLPQRESLQVLYIGMQYDNPLVRQSNCYFQILFVGLQVALAHNEALRQRAAIVAAAAQAADAMATGSSLPLLSAPSSPLGGRPERIEWLDLGPGRRFVKEHLGAVGHPISMYTRGIGPLAHAMSRRLLSRHFQPGKYLNDP